MGIIASILSIIGVASTAITAGGAAVAVSAANIVFGVVYGGYAICKSLASKKNISSSSPTYNGTLQTQVNNQLPLALIYGQNKLAGNVIWQKLDTRNNRICKFIAFGEGEIEYIEDVRLNDIAFADIQDIRSWHFNGLPQAQICEKAPGNNDMEKIANVGSLKNVAYLVLDVKLTNDIGANFNTTAVVKGRKVRVYTSPTAYITKYSSNPAWCLLDFLTAYNGCGIGLDENGNRNINMITELIDINSFIEAAAFCDQIVDGKPRFSFNMVFDSQSSRRDIIEEFKKSCRGALVMKGKQLQFKIDRSSTAIKTILASDIIADTEQITTIPTEENYDRIIIKYRSKAHDWAIVETYAERPTFDNIPPVEHTVEIYSILEHEQATRLAWYYLNKVNLERVFGYFETDYRVFDLEIGDIISLSDNLMKYNNKPVKVTRMIDKNDGTFGVYWREYNPTLYTDTPGSLAPTVTEIDDKDVFRAPGNIEYFHVVQNQNLYMFTWKPVEEEGVTYEIRLGKTWENSSLQGEYISNANFSTIIRTDGLQTFLIKARSQYGIYSENAAAFSINIGEIPTLNIILKQNLLEEEPEKMENCYRLKNVLRLQTEQKWKFQSGLKWSRDEYYAIGGTWGALCKEAGSAQTPVFDLKENIKSFISLLYESNEYQKSKNIRIYWQYSIDNLNWSDWEEFSPQQVEFRYYRFKFELARGSLSKVYIQNLMFVIDVEDRDEYYHNLIIENANDGITINFATNPQSKLNRPFYGIPSVVANTCDGSTGYCTVSYKTQDSCTIKAYDIKNTPINAFVDVHVKGY